MSLVSSEKSCGAVAVGAVGGVNLAQVEAAERLQPLLERRDRRLGLLGAPAETLAGAFVDDERHDAGQGIALLALQHRVGQREHEQRRGERTKQRAANALPGEHDDHEQQHAGKRRNQRPGQERVEGDRQARHGLAHWPSRSSSAGTCTWSAL